MKQEHKLMKKEDGLVQLTRQQIADLTGLRVETVIRTIRRMHEDGILVLKGHKIYYNGR
jgi:CRP-like cAMP-binding protein